VCHVSVGHVARAVEEAGIPTVSIYVRAFRHVVEEMKLPRTVVVKHPMGRPLGAPGDADRHTEVVDAALDLLATATEGMTIRELEVDWRPGTV
jgi:hypothetical protein